METLATRFTLIFAGLQAAVARCLPREQSLAPLLVMVCHYFDRTASRLQRLLAHWRAGTLPTPRAPRPGRASKPRISPNRLPAGRAWLLRHAQPAAVYNTYFRTLMAEPDFAEFLAAAPQAARLLRPLLHMLTIDPLPLAIARPPRPPRPPRPKPVKPPPPCGPPPTPDRPIPANIRAAARAWKKRYR